MTGFAIATLVVIGVGFLALNSDEAALTLGIAGGFGALALGFYFFVKDKS